MKKYQTEFKLEVVQSFLAGEGGAKLLARRWLVPEEKIRTWVSHYRFVLSERPGKQFLGDSTSKIHLVRGRLTANLRVSRPSVQASNSSAIQPCKFIFSVDV